MTFMYTLLLVTAAILVGLASFTAHKVRRIHLAQYAIAADVAAARREAESLFPQLQALAALERKLRLDLPLPPLRKWAGSPDFLLVVANEIERRRPKVVMECSSGASTVVCARMLQILEAGHVYSLEHDPAYAEATRRLLARYGVSEWGTVIDAPLTESFTPTPWYSQDAIPQKIGEIDILVVDGPPMATATLARYPALPALKGRLARDAIVILDDADRVDERETLRRWHVEMPGLRQETLDCEKGCALLYLNDQNQTIA